MKIQVNSSDLLRCLSAVQKVMSSKNSLSILDSALLSQTGNKYFLTGGDTANSLSMPVDMKVLEGDFKPVCLNVKMMLSALGSIGSQPLTITIDEQGKGFAVNVQYLTGNFSLMAQSADDYPPTSPITDAQTQYQMPSAVMLPAIKNALSNCASDELRMVMNGVYFDATEDGNVTMVASDGHTMYKESYEHGIPFYTQGGAKGIIVPKTIIGALDTAFRGTDLITVTANDNMMMFQATTPVGSADGDSTITLYARTIEGRYPNYGSVIPVNQPYHLTLNRRELTDAVKRVSLFASEATHLVCLTYEGGTVVLKTEDIDFSTSAKETLTPVDANVNEGFQIGFKSENLLTHLAYMPTDNVTIELTDASHPMIIRPDGDGTVERIAKTEMNPAVKTPVLTLVMPIIIEG